MASKNRQHARIPCDLDIAVHDPRTGAFMGAARLLDIAVGGGALETELQLERGIWYELRWRWKDQSVRIPARLAWDGHRDPRTGSQRYGVSFTPHPGLQDQLKAMISHVRQQLWMTDGRDARDYWRS